MHKNKRNSIIMVAICFILAVVCLSTPILFNNPNTNDLASQSNQNTKVSALYVGGVDSLDELINESDIIVKGIANEIISESEVGLTMSFYVEETIKGDISTTDNLEIIQLKDGSELKIGETYILALEDHPLYDEITYHIKGGTQGIFEINSNRISCNDAIIQEDLMQIQKYSSKSVVQVDNVLNYFENVISDIDTELE